MMGGRRNKKSRKTRKMKGSGYGVGAPINAGNLEYVKNSTSTPYSSATGAAIPDPFGTTGGTSSVLMGGRRRTRKGGKKSRKTKKAGRRHRKMRGGASEYNVGAVRAEFTGNTSGTGPFTYGTYASAPSKVGGYGPSFGADGVAKSS